MLLSKVKPSATVLSSIVNDKASDNPGATLRKLIDEEIDLQSNVDPYYKNPHYKYVDNYLRLRYPKQRTEIHTFLSSNKIGRVYALKCLGNWQKKRLMRDLDLITTLNGSLLRTKVDRTVDPSRQCNQIVRSMEINLENVPYSRPRRSIVLGKVELDDKDHNDIKKELSDRGIVREPCTDWGNFEWDEYDIENRKLTSEKLKEKKEKAKIPIKKRVEAKIAKFGRCQGIIEPYNGVFGSSTSYKDILLRYKKNVDEKFQKVHLQVQDISKVTSGGEKRMTVPKPLSHKPALREIARRHLCSLRLATQKSAHLPPIDCPEGFQLAKQPAFISETKAENDIQLDNYYRHLELLSEFDDGGVSDVLKEGLRCHVHLSSCVKMGIVKLKKDKDDFIREKIGEVKFKKYKKDQAKKAKSKSKSRQLKPYGRSEKDRKEKIQMELIERSYESCAIPWSDKKRKDRLRKGYLRLLLGKVPNSRWEALFSSQYPLVYDKMLILRKELSLLQGMKDVALTKLTYDCVLFEETEETQSKNLTKMLKESEVEREKMKVSKKIKQLEAEISSVEKEVQDRRAERSKMIDTRTPQQKRDDMFRGEVAKWEREVKLRRIEEEISHLKSVLGENHMFKYNPALTMPERKISKNELKALRKKAEEEEAQRVKREAEERKIRSAEMKIKEAEDKAKAAIEFQKEWYRKRGCIDREDWISKGQPPILEEFKEPPKRRSLEDMMF